MPGVFCTQCGERFYWTEHYGEKTCPRCKAVQFYASVVSSEYTAPECPFDFAAATRDRIIEEVTLHGLCYRCPLDLSTAFSGWDHEEINRWCDENGLMITARFDGQIVISRIDADFDATAEGSTIYEHYRHGVICAEVEAMDWPEVIGE
jgi:hypothetical protein